MSFVVMLSNIVAALLLQPRIASFQRMVAPGEPQVSTQQEVTPKGLIRASPLERLSIQKGPVDWKIVAAPPAGPVKYGTAPIFTITLTNQATHDAEFYLGAGYFLLSEEVLDEFGVPVIVEEPDGSKDTGCSPCLNVVMHPGDRWLTHVELPPWYLKAMKPGSYWVRFSKYDLADRTTDWSNKIRVTIIP